MKIVKICLSLIALSLSTAAVAVPPSYNGLDVKGLVRVGDHASGGLSLHADMNVRSNPMAGHEKSYVYAIYYPGGTIHFNAYDASSDRSFTCFVETTHRQYDDIAAVANNLQDGMRISISTTPSCDGCNWFQVINASFQTQ